MQASAMFLTAEVKSALTGTAENQYHQRRSRQFSGRARVWKR
jgi:hypothetical protein